MHIIRVTTIEKFRRFMTEASSFDTEVSLIDTIKGTFTGNDKTRTGSCFHKIIEQDALVVPGGIIAEADGVKIFFTDEQAAPAVEFKRQHPAMIHEIEVGKIYETKFGPIKIGGRIDGLEGMEVQDTKTKYRDIDLLDYSDSYQWRFYLELIGLDMFHYDIFQVHYFEALTGSMPYQLNGVVIDEPVRLQCLRYNAMADDCRQLLQEFMDYIHFRNLWPFLKTVTTQPALS